MMHEDHYSMPKIKKKKKTKIWLIIFNLKAWNSSDAKLY